MLVYANEFPAAEGTELRDIVSAGKTWLVGSQHYPWNDEADLPEVDMGIASAEHSGQRVWVGRTTGAAGEMAGLRHRWSDSNMEWTTEIVAVDLGESVWVTVRLFCELLRKGVERPYPKKPYIVKTLFRQLGGGMDGPLRVADAPRQLSEREVGLARELMLGSAGNHLPVVYVSVDFAGGVAVDPRNAARKLSGLAHVVVEPSRAFSIVLSRAVARRNAYGGAVGIYWPGGDGQHLRYLRRDYSSIDDLFDDVVRRVRAAASHVRPAHDCSWTELRQAVSKRALEAVRSSNGASVQNWVDAFEEENNALTAKLRDLENENTRLRALSRGVQASSPIDALLEDGDEQNLYYGEIRDIVLDALKAALARSADSSRRHDVLSALLEANKYTGNGSSLRDSIRKTLLKSRDLDADAQGQLRRLGFSMTSEGKHHKLIFAGDDRYTFTTAKTTSDHRATKNLVSVINQKLFK